MTQSGSTSSLAAEERPRPHPLLGYFAIAAATFCWAASANLGKAAFTGKMLASGPRLDALVLSQARTTISFLILVPLMLAFGGRRALSLPFRDVLRCLLLGTIGGAASNFFYYYAIDRTSVDTAIILQYTAPVLVLLYMVARRLQRATLARLVGVGAAVVGSTLAIGIGPGHLKLDTPGVVAAELAAVSFAFWNVYGHGLLQRLGIWQTLAYAFLGASLFWIVVNPPWKIAHAGYTGAQWVFLVVFACLSLLIPYALYFLGLKHLDATRAVVTSCLEPVFTIALAAVFLKELLDWVQVLGVALVLAATIVVQVPEKEGERVEPFVAE